MEVEEQQVHLKVQQVGEVVEDFPLQLALDLGTFRQRTEITKSQPGILKALKIDAPPRIYQLKPPVEP